MAQLSNERIQEFKDIFEKESGKEMSWAEAAEGANNLVGYFDLLYGFWIKDKQREKKLEEFPKGFTIEGVGYSCAICRNSTPENGNWYDKWGIKCLTCQASVDRGEVPPWVAKHEDSFYSKYDLESRFNAKHQVVKRWVKEGVLKPCNVLNDLGKVHTQIFLLKDNKDTLPPKRLTKHESVSEEKDGKTWFRVEPWYRFVDPYEHLKGYKILDRLSFTMVKRLKFKHDFVKEILEGRKTTTWRLFDDKDLQIDDELELIDAENGISFGKAKIINVKEKTIKDLSVQELNDHQYENKDKMIESHRKYYGDKVNDDTILKIITFGLL